MKDIVQYKNGNVTVTLDLSDGTKERFTEDDEFHPEFPESIDVNISYRCDGNCPFCYADCTIFGRHANLSSPWVTDTFIPSLKPYTELALNGNDLSHPQLEGFLALLKENKIIANLTVNQRHFMKHLDLLHRFQTFQLIHGLGISLSDSTDKKFISEMKKFPNSVIHTVAGILTRDDIINLSSENLKLLILGYKCKGRGGNYFSNNYNQVSGRIYELRSMLPKMMEEGYFNLVSFDNLAVEQLEVKTLVSEEEWNRYYMGDDGSFTFFIDLVEMKFARDSMTTDLHYTDDKDAVEMFNTIRRLS